MNHDWRLRLEQQRERARRLDRENAEAIEKADAMIAKLKQVRAEYEEHLRQKSASNLTSTAGTKRALEDEHTTTAKRPTPAHRPTLQQLSPLPAPVDDAHFQLGDNEDQTLGAAEDDDFDDLFAIANEAATSGTANITIHQPIVEYAYMADPGAGGEEEVEEEQSQEDEGEGQTEEIVLEKKRGRGRPKGKPKKGNQKAPLLPIYVYSLESGGAWVNAEDVGFWNEGENAIMAHVAKMIKGTKKGNVHKLFARIVDKGDQEINLPDAQFACFGCSVLGANKRDKCNITVRDASACDECVRLKRPCGQLIRDPNRPGGFAYGFLSLHPELRKDIPESQLAYWVTS
ncbi:hypothetical protein E8E11_004735 [Didymella keratinophila]|nr:hypothetical protein E8E11_004735 [Didymella keratinophila]